MTFKGKDHGIDIGKAALKGNLLGGFGVSSITLQSRLRHAEHFAAQERDGYQVEGFREPDFIAGLVVWKLIAGVRWLWSVHARH